MAVAQSGQFPEEEQEKKNIRITTISMNHPKPFKPRRHRHTIPQRQRSKPMIFRILALSFLFCWTCPIWQSSCSVSSSSWFVFSEEIQNDNGEEIQNDNDDDEAYVEEEEKEEESSPGPNPIDELRKAVKVDYSNVDFSDSDPSAIAMSMMKTMTDTLTSRVTKLFTKAETPECRAKIAEHLGYFVNAIGLERSLPFTDVKFRNECDEPVYNFRDMPEGVGIGEIQNRTYQPPRNETDYIENPDDLIICYGILTHDNPNATIRLIESLDEDGLKHRHIFVIHVDGKEKHDSTQHELLDYAATRDHIHVLDNHRRVRVNWGGFSMVNATLQILQYAFNINEISDGSRDALNFHKFIHLSASTYPLASNIEIRHRIASYPLDANFFHIIMSPTRASPSVWHYFVECDDALHRIYQLPILHDQVHGANTFTSSQWFIISHEFAEYLATVPTGSFVDEYLRYIQHVVVADETFFGTVLRHTKFCHKHHNDNFLHLQFDRWESELPASKRDERKCPMPNPDHCGRSPTTMTLDYADIMELSDKLFARKFDDTVDTAVKSVVDQWRNEREQAIRNGTDPLHANKMENFDFEGHGVMIVAKDTINDEVPLCMALGDRSNKIQLLPCFEEWVRPTLADDWETGAVIEVEAVPHTRWQVGPCTSDGKLERLPSGVINVTLGEYSKTGPRCMLKQMDGIRAGRCYDSGSASFQPGGETQVYPCTREWYQFVSIGDGRVAPKGSLFSTIPSHIVRQIRNLGHKQTPYMCLGVYDRGNEDELDWNDDEYKKTNRQANMVTLDATESWESLSEWNGENIVATQCSNKGAVIEWAFVPFIVEEFDEEQTNENKQTADENEEL